MQKRVAIPLVELIVFQNEISFEGFGCSAEPDPLVCSIGIFCRMLGIANTPLHPCQQVRESCWIGCPSAAIAFEPVSKSVELFRTVNTEPSKWFGFPVSDFVIDPRMSDQMCVSLEDEISQGLSSQICGRYAYSDIAPSPRHSGMAINTDACTPVSWHGHDATPHVI